MRIRASFEGVQLQTTEMTVEIRVLRNEHAPVFEPNSYEAEVLEYIPLGASILRVTASDEDENVSITSNASFNRVT